MLLGVMRNTVVPIPLGYSTTLRRRRIWRLTVGVAGSMAVAVAYQRLDVQSWVSRRWLVWLGYRAQSACLGHDPGPNVLLARPLPTRPLTPARVTGGVAVEEVDAFGSAASAAAMAVAGPTAPLAPPSGGLPSPGPTTLCVRELVRPDGVRRLLIAQVDAYAIHWFVFGEATPIRPAAQLTVGEVDLGLPRPHAPNGGPGPAPIPGRHLVGPCGPGGWARGFARTRPGQ